MNPKSPPPEHCTPAFVEAFNRSVPIVPIERIRVCKIGLDGTTAIIEIPTLQSLADALESTGVLECSPGTIFTFTVDEMSRAEIDALPDFEGY